MPGVNKQHYIEKYGKELGLEKYKEYCKTRVVNEAKLIKLYGEELGKQKWKECCLKKVYSKTLEYHIEKYGEELGKQKWKEFGKNSTHTIENMIQRYGETEGIIRYNERNRKVGYANTLKYYIEKYGEELGKIEFQKRIDKSKCSLEGFINRNGIEEGTKKYEERNIRVGYYASKKYYIEKFGELTGIEIFDEIQNKRKFKQSLKYYIEKYGEIDGLSKWRDLNRRKTNNGLNFGCHGYSKISQVLFNELLEQIDDKENVYFAEHQKEFGINQYNVDFCYHNKIIEFNGDIFHANPKLFKEWMEPNPFNNMKAIEIWKKDNERLKIINESGYQILVIWELDFIENKECIIKKCLDFIKTI